MTTKIFLVRHAEAEGNLFRVAHGQYDSVITPQGYRQLAWLRRRALRRRTVTAGPTWGCGFTAPNVRMQYTGESFSEGLQSIATSLTQNSGEGRAVDKAEIFPATHNFDIRHKDKIDRLFAAWWVELLHQINRRVMRLRTGKINHYVLFALAFLVLVFVLSVLNLL